MTILTSKNKILECGGSRCCPGVDPDAWPLCFGLRKAKFNTMVHFSLLTSLFTEQLSLTVLLIKQLSSFGSKHTRDFSSEVKNLTQGEQKITDS